MLATVKTRVVQSMRAKLASGAGEPLTRLEAMVYFGIGESTFDSITNKQQHRHTRLDAYKIGRKTLVAQFAIKDYETRMGKITL